MTVEGAAHPPTMIGCAAVERLVERLPQIAEIKAEQSWERQKARPGGAEKRSLLTLVEAVLV